MVKTTRIQQEKVLDSRKQTEGQTGLDREDKLKPAANGVGRCLLRACWPYAGPTDAKELGHRMQLWAPETDFMSTPAVARRFT